MPITRKVLPYKIAEPSTLTLMSDLHIGGRTTLYSKIKQELKIAKDEGDRILLNGDIFDAILPRDAKRFVPEVLHEKLLGYSDILGGAIKMAEDILGPYAPFIDMIGLGNHEISVEKYHSIDIIGELVRRLNEYHGGEITYGDVTGFADYRFRRGTPPKTRIRQPGNRFVIYYHHGAGGASPVTKGMIDFARKLVWMGRVDLVWLGHKHNRLLDGTTMQISCPLTGDDPILTPITCVMTGGYNNSYNGYTEAQWKAGGRRGNFPKDKGLAPQKPGGARVFIKHDKNSGIESTKVLM